MDASTILAATETAILQCLTAQSYTVAGRAKNMAQLAELRAFRRELIEEIRAAGESGGSMSSLARTDGAQ